MHPINKSDNLLFMSKSSFHKLSRLHIDINNTTNINIYKESGDASSHPAFYTKY